MVYAEGHCHAPCSRHGMFAMIHSSALSHPKLGNTVRGGDEEQSIHPPHSHKVCQGMSEPCWCFNMICGPRRHPWRFVLGVPNVAGWYISGGRDSNERSLLEAPLSRHCNNKTWKTRKERSTREIMDGRCLVHTGKPTGVAVPHCTTWFQTQLILTTCQIRYHAIVGSS